LALVFVHHRVPRLEQWADGLAVKVRGCDGLSHLVKFGWRESDHDVGPPLAR
jgi:hypothetical protein